jgi:hypothetical protein
MAPSVRCRRAPDRLVIVGRLPARTTCHASIWDGGLGAMRSRSSGFLPGPEPTKGTRTTMATLPESIAAERDHCRRLACDFDRLGSTGAFGAALIHAALSRAETALGRGDAGAMHSALEELRRIASLRCSPVRPARGNATGATLAYVQL